MSEDREPSAQERLGLVLKLVRTRAGLSLEEASQRANVEVHTLEAYESGAALPSKKWVSDLRKSYGVRMSQWISHREQRQMLRPLYGGQRFSRTPADVKEVRDVATGLLVIQRFPPGPNGRKIFIGYRRKDQAGFAGRLYDKLVATFGHRHIFIDVGSYDLGLDYLDDLETTLDRCRCLLVVIGPNWLNAMDEDGNRRLDQLDDLVRYEIEISLRREIPVIPVLVDGTPMPRASELPDSIKGLTSRRACEIANETFNQDCSVLITALKRTHGH